MTFDFGQLGITRDFGKNISVEHVNQACVDSEEDRRCEDILLERLCCEKENSWQMLQSKKKKKWKDVH